MKDKDTNGFNSSVNSLLKGMEGFVSSKTVVGDAIHVNDSIILPLVDIQFGVGAGAFSSDKKDNTGGGIGARISPSAVLVIQNGVTKLVNIKNQDTVTKILDMVPDIVNRFTSKNQYQQDDATDEVIQDIAKEGSKTETTQNQ